MNQARDRETAGFVAAAPTAADDPFCRGIEEEMTRALRGQCVLSLLHFHARRLGSMEEYLARLSADLRRFGGRSVIALDSPPAPEVRDLFDAAGAELEFLPFDQGNRAVLKALDAILRRQTPHVAHLHHVSLTSPVIHAAGRRGARVFLSHHISVEPGGERIPRLRRVLARAYRRFTCRGVERIITPSEFTRQHLIQGLGFAPRRVVAIHNGVNLDRHHPGRHEPVDIRQRYSLHSDEAIVIHIAFAHRYKGIDDFVRSATVLRDRGIACRHFVVGDGQLMETYRKLSADIGCADRVTFTGLVDGPTLDSLLAQCDVSTLACTWGEAFSLVIIESLARGKAMVATRVGGTPEAICHDDNGLLVPAGDWRLLGESIARVLTDDDLRHRLEHNARVSAERCFDVRRWTRQTLALFAYGDPERWEADQ